MWVRWWPVIYQERQIALILLGILSSHFRKSGSFLDSSISFPSFTPFEFMIVKGFSDYTLIVANSYLSSFLLYLVIDVQGNWTLPPCFTNRFCHISQYFLSAVIDQFSILYALVMNINIYNLLKNSEFT